VAASNDNHQGRDNKNDYAGKQGSKHRVLKQLWHADMWIIKSTSGGWRCSWMIARQWWLSLKRLLWLCSHPSQSLEIFTVYCLGKV